MNMHPRLRYWIIIAGFTVTAVTLFIVNATVLSPGRGRDFSQSIAEALVVAIVVSLAVEPRLLRYFGEELASQTFWSSFFSRAPQGYRDAIKELASADRFAISIHWTVTFDWADKPNSIIRLTGEYAYHIENRSSKPYPCRPQSFIYEPRFPGLTSDISSFSLACPDADVFINLTSQGLVKLISTKDGRLFATGADDSDKPYANVPPGKRYSTTAASTTYVDSTGHIPILVVYPTLLFTIQFNGDALDDLYIAVLAPATGKLSPYIEGTGEELMKKGRIAIGDVFIEGQAILLSWKMHASAGAQSP